jgi:hypothetical protein
VLDFARESGRTLPQSKTWLSITFHARVLQCAALLIVETEKASLRNNQKADAAV